MAKTAARWKFFEFPYTLAFSILMDSLTLFAHHLPFEPDTVVVSSTWLVTLGVIMLALACITGGVAWIGKKREQAKQSAKRPTQD